MPAWSTTAISKRLGYLQVLLIRYASAPCALHTQDCCPQQLKCYFYLFVFMYFSAELYYFEVSGFRTRDTEIYKAPYCPAYDASGFSTGLLTGAKLTMNFLASLNFSSSSIGCSLNVTIQS